ncbi:MAG TPA: VOC family protein [Candidatus Polarisedimenticolia bacterium]|nr:VOC family protein [Candidatus Polarisedimenticolia bacterium]
MLRQLDHVVLVARDLNAAIADHRRRGFTVTPGGEHADGVTHNALITFADGSYLEIVAFRDLARALSHRWWKFAADGGGLADFALLSDDLAGDAAALAELVKTPPKDGGRIRPDGVELKWRTALLQPPLPFVIEDLTARDLRVPGGAAAEHANGATGIASVVVGAVDIADTEWRYAALRERGAPRVEIRKAAKDGVLDVRFRSV